MRRLGPSEPPGSHVPKERFGTVGFSANPTTRAGARTEEKKGRRQRVTRMDENSFPPALRVAMVLMAQELYPDLMWPTLAEMLASSGADEKEAYECLARLRELAPTLLRKPGRPACPAMPTQGRTAALAAVCNFLVRHPGALLKREEGHLCTDDYRRFVVGLGGPGQPGEGLSHEELASVTCVPLETLHEWLCNPVPEPTSTPPPTAPKRSRKRKR